MENQPLKVPTPKGRALWKIRKPQPSTRLYGDPEQLWAEACAYFRWCDNTPWLRAELVKYKGTYEEAEVPIGRPYSMDGFTIYLGVAGSYFRTVKGDLKEKIEAKKATEKEKELLTMIETIETVVRTQQIEGASVGVFNPAIVARVNGLAEVTNVNTTGDTVVRVSVRDKQTAINLQELNDLL